MQYVYVPSACSSWRRFTKTNLRFKGNTHHGSFAPSFSFDKKRSMQSLNPTQVFFCAGFLVTLSWSSDSYDKICHKNDHAPQWVTQWQAFETEIVKGALYLKTNTQYCTAVLRKCLFNSIRKCTVCLSNVTQRLQHPLCLINMKPYF